MSLTINVKTVKEYLDPESERPEEERAFVVFKQPTRETILLTAELLKTEQASSREMEEHVRKRTVELGGVEIECNGELTTPDLSDWNNLPEELLGLIIGAYYRCVKKTFFPDKDSAEKNESSELSPVTDGSQ